MPSYSHLFETKFDQKSLPGKIAAMVRLGVPYPVMTDVEIKEAAIQQGIEIVNALKTDKIVASPDTQIIALIAYLQKLGKYETLEVDKSLEQTPQAVPMPLTPVNPDRHRAAYLENTLTPSAE